MGVKEKSEQANVTPKSLECGIECSDSTSRRKNHTPEHHKTTIWYFGVLQMVDTLPRLCLSKGKEPTGAPTSLSIDDLFTRRLFTLNYGHHGSRSTEQWDETCWCVDTETNDYTMVLLFLIG